MKQRALSKIKKELVNTFGADAVIGFGAARFASSYKGTIILIDVWALTYFELIHLL